MDPSQEVALLRMQVYSFQAALNELRSRVALMEDDDVLPWPEPDGGGGSSGVPEAVYYRGVACTELGSSPGYSASNPFLWVHIPDLTYEWKNTRVGASPDSDYVRDYSVNELHIGEF